jgi:hypothetical protein
MNKKYDNNNIIIASRAYFLQNLVGFGKLSLVSSNITLSFEYKKKKEVLVDTSFQLSFMFSS